MTNVFPAIAYTKISFGNTDHHIMNYRTFTCQLRDHWPIALAGGAKATDSSNHIANGEVTSNALCYFEANQGILHSTFNSQEIGAVGDIDMGALPNNTMQKIINLCALSINLTYLLMKRITMLGKLPYQAKLDREKKGMGI